MSTRKSKISSQSIQRDFFNYLTQLTLPYTSENVSQILNFVYPEEVLSKTKQPLANMARADLGLDLETLGRLFNQKDQTISKYIRKSQNYFNRLFILQGRDQNHLQIGFTS